MLPSPGKWKSSRKIEPTHCLTSCLTNPPTCGWVLLITYKAVSLNITHSHFFPHQCILHNRSAQTLTHILYIAVRLVLAVLIIGTKSNSDNFLLNKSNEGLPVCLQFLLCTMETEFQHLSFQVWLLHTLRAVLFAIISKVTVKKCKLP